MTGETFSQIMALFAETYGIEWSDERLKVWRMLLAELPDDVARAAAVRLCQSSPFPPKPSDLFRIVRGDPKEVESILAEEAELACCHLEQHLVDYRACDLGPVLNAVVRQMNGPDAVVAQMITEDWKFCRPRVKQLYTAFRRRGVPDDFAQPALPIAVVERGVLDSPVVVARFEPTPQQPAFPDAVSA